jgi:hypothetical protein
MLRQIVGFLGRHMKKTASLIAALVALFCFAALSWAQTPTGSIEGTVTDPTGAVVPNAKVTVIEKATARTIPVTTSGEGFYAVRNLLPGVYDVKVESAGFAVKELKDVAVNSGAAVNANFSLEIGKTGEVIEVASQAVSVDTARQTVDSIVSGTQIKELPLFSRNFLDLAALAPGVIVRDGGNIDPTKNGAFRAVGINGRSGTGTRVQVDGIDVTDETVGTTVANISNEAVQQFQLTRSSLDISTSLGSSGAINVVTNSGSNQLHGSWFYDYYNQDLGARLQYQASAAAFNRKRTGGSVGFPIFKNKLFGYANWEKWWQNTNFVSTVPEFPQFNIVQPVPQKLSVALFRLDWNVTPSSRLFYKFQHNDDLSPAGSAISPYQNIDWTNVHTIGFDFAKGRTTSAIRFGYTNFNNRIGSQELNTKFLNVGGSAIQLNVGPISWGPNGNAPQSTYQDNWQFSYDGSYLWNKHTFRYGASYTHIRLGGFANFAGPLSVSGTYDAGTIASLQAAGVDIKDPTNFPLSSFSLGPQNGYFTLAGCDGLPHGCHINNRTAFFGGDSIKLTRRLTLNLGLRFEYDSGYFNNEPDVPRDPILETWGKGYSARQTPPKLWNPSIGVVWDPTGSGKTSIRAGFYRAYEMNIFNNLIFDEFVQLPPGIGPDSYDFSRVTGPDGTPINVDGKHPTGDYSGLAGQPIKTVLPLIAQVNGALQAAYNNYKFDPKVGKSELQVLGQDFDGIYPGKQFKAPYAIQGNIGVQHELRPGTVISVDYIYNHGVGMPFFIRDFELRHDASTLNAAAASAKVAGVLKGLTVDQWIAANPTKGINAFALGTDATFTGITPNFQFMRFIQGGFTKYQGLQVELRGRVQKDHLHVVKSLFYTVAYSRGNGQSSAAASRAEFLAGPLDNHNPNSSATFGPNNLNFRHTLTSGALMTIPGGFQLNSVWTFRTPGAQNITLPNFSSFTSSSNAIFSTDLNGDGGTGTGSPRADVLPGVNAGQFGRDVGSLSQLNQIITAFNQNNAGKLTPAGQALVTAGIFSQAQLIKLGAVQPTIPLVPDGAPNPWHNLFTTDLRVTRPIKIKERWKVSPFADIINLFNHAPMALYGGLGNTFGSLNFNYTTTPGRLASDLTASRGRLNGLRQVQLGVRLDF